ncbi:MAG TPA: ABC transporter substrate-binding protein [Clostridia bacterium]|nr:ABC transporter substrate-binding protein [Clostridia bacterium]HRU84731.1 ABC transporter substrate-binding protein [Eubacteriales bacterium]
MKTSNKLRICAIILLLVLFAIPLFSACDKPAIDVLVIYNWADYISPDALDGFSEYYFEATGREVQITYSTFDTNENMLTTLINGKAKVDLICPSEYAIQKLLQNDFIMELDFSKIENSVNVYGDIKDSIASIFGGLIIDGKSIDMTKYFVPYMWGTLGILYNADVVTEADLENGWGLLWNEAKNPELTGKILVKDSIRDTYAAAVLYLAENDLLPASHKDKSIQELINTVDAEMLAAAESVLSAQRSELKGYEVDFGKDDMITGAAYVDLAWSGDALWAIEEGELEGVNLDYFVPEIGGNVWFDGWVIPKNAQNVDAALLFINYMCLPEIAIMNSMEIGYTNSIDPEILQSDEVVLAILEENEYDVEEYFSDIRRYPVVDEKLGVMSDFGEANELAVAMWERVKAGMGDSEGLGDLAVPVYILVGIAALVLIFTAVYFIVDKLKIRPRPI